MAQEKFHIALSFAGEDRQYVDVVATELRSRNINVFYDKFEEVNLWGKNLYDYLSDIYKNRAMFTVMFVSKHYKDKLWTNHERVNAQARAFQECKEYILPAVFDIDVEIPGLNKTVGYIDLNKNTPKELAEKIAEKLRLEKILIPELRSYTDEALADVDFPFSESVIGSTLLKLKSSVWQTQNAALNRFLSNPSTNLSSDDWFVLGRNILQCADGSERRAESFIKDLRTELAKFSKEVAGHILNGILYEIYFNKNGEFRGERIKGKLISDVLKIQAVKKYSNSIAFIRQALEPYKDLLAIRPNFEPENVELKINIEGNNPSRIVSIKYRDIELLVPETSEDRDEGRLWIYSHKEFLLAELYRDILKEWFIPKGQLNLISNKRSEKDEQELRLLKKHFIDYPFKINKSAI